jgi:hypothetical protein
MTIHTPKSVSLEHPCAGPQPLCVRGLLAAELHDSPPTKAEVQTFNEVQSTVEGLLEQLESADPDNRGRELENARLAYSESPCPELLERVQSLAARQDNPSAQRAYAAAGEAVMPLVDTQIARLRPLAFRLIDGAARRFEVVARPLESGADGLLGLLADGDVAAVAGFIRERLDATRRQLNHWRQWCERDGSMAFLRDYVGLPSRLEPPRGKAAAAG